MLAALLNRYRSISLQELERVRMMIRMDFKYLFREEHLPEFLDACQPYYQVLEVHHDRKFSYRTRYLDTPCLQCYHDHHNGVRPRYKIRFREYLDSGLSFLEVKQKDNKERTTKKRVESKSSWPLDHEQKNFIGENVPVSPDVLRPQLVTTFNRITLIDKKRIERITIDTGVRFSHGEKTAHMNGLVISEIKRDRFSSESFFIKLLLERSIRSFNISKYGLGIALLMEDIKKNRFKEKIHFINRVKYA